MGRLVPAFQASVGSQLIPRADARVYSLPALRAWFVLDFEIPHKPGIAMSRSLRETNLLELKMAA